MTTLKPTSGDEMNKEHQCVRSTSNVGKPNYATAWFLVMFGGAQWLGPLPQEGCQRAANALLGQGAVCKQASAMSVCQAPNLPGTYMACPVFDFPQVTVKP